MSASRPDSALGTLQIRITARTKCHQYDAQDGEAIAEAYHFEVLQGTMREAMDTLSMVSPSQAWMAGMTPSADGTMFDFAGANIQVGTVLDMR